MTEYDKVTYTACQGWGCHEHCVLTTYVKDGVIERTERTIVKGKNAERGGLCQKGAIMGKYPYLKERLLHPLKRVGKRGEGKFEEISWDQALDEIGSKLCELRDKYGPRSIITNTFPCGLPICFGGLSLQLALRFVHTSDCTRLHLPGVDQTATFPFGIEFGDTGYSALIDPDIMLKADHILIWGGNPIGFTRAAHTTRTLVQAQEQGSKLVAIGTVFDTTAAKADQFVPVKPGSDAALAMAMAKIIIDEDRCDYDALTRYTVAPLLVREDNGQFLRAADVMDGYDGTVFMYFDAESQSALPIERGSFEIPWGTADLRADVEVAGIHCKTAFVKLIERLEPYTPEYQETITGVPAETCVQMIHEYLDANVASIFENLGFRYSTATHSIRAINLLPMLSGNFTKEGGRFINCPLSDGFGVSLNEPEVMWPDGFENVKGECAQFVEILDALEDPEHATQQYKAFINPFANPLHCWPNPQTFGEKFLDRLELVVVFELRETDTTAWADYVLPECTPFEREEIIAPSANCVVLQEPAIEPLGESKPPAFIWGEIAKRYGLGAYFDKTTEEWHRMRLAGQDLDKATDSTDLAQSGIPNSGTAGMSDDTAGVISYDRLKEEKIILITDNEDNDVYAQSPMQFGTPTGRVEFYCEALYDVDFAITKWEPLLVWSDEPEKYPLRLFPGRHRVFMQSQFHEFPELRQIGGESPSVTLNPITARERGISEGDIVEVFNHRGSVRTRAEISEAYPPGMAHLWYAYPKKDHMTNPPTVLSAALSSRETETPFSKRWGKVWLDQNVAQGVPQVLIFQNGSLDTVETLWEDMCDVRKVEEA